MLVVKGFHQVPGSDYRKTLSPVVRSVTIQVILLIVITRNWSIQQLDFNNAFLNVNLKEKVYIQQPPGGFFNHNDSSLVCRLHKALYILKQAP